MSKKQYKIEREKEKCEKCHEQIEYGHEWYCNRGAMRYKEQKTNRIYRCY